MMSPVGSADITRQWIGGGTELLGRPGVGGTDSLAASVANLGTKVPSSVTCVPEFGFPVRGRGGSSGFPCAEGGEFRFPVCGKGDCGGYCFVRCGDLLGGGRGLLVGDGGAHLVHVGIPHGLDELLKSLLGQCPSLGVDDDSIADRHQGRDGGDLEDLGEPGLGLGVHLGEDDVGVGFADLLEDRGKRPARPAPGGPEVDEDDGAVLHGRGEGLFSQGNGRHTPQGITRLPGRRHDGGMLDTPVIGREAGKPRAGRLLVSAPALEEPFHRAVILLLEHDESGTLGVVLNQPTNLDVGTVLPLWRSHLTGEPQLFQGGPVALDSALGLAATTVPTDDAVDVEPEGFRRVSGPLGIIDLDTPPDDLVPHLQALRIYAGYAGWAPGQLMDELERGSWAVVAAGDPVADVFHVDPVDLWRGVLSRAGGTLAWWPGCPDDPAMN